MKRFVPILLSLFLLLVTGRAGATLVGTYVDAKALGGSPNTTPSGAFSPTYSGSFSDNLWDDRSGQGLNSAGQLSGTQNVLEAGPTGGETVPTITESISGLTSGTYDVYLLYWSPGGAADWSVRARLSGSGSFTEFDRSGAGGNTPGTLVGISGPLGDLYEAKLAMVSGSSIAVDLLNSTSGDAVNNRTEFDGIAFALVPEPSSVLLMLVGGLLAWRCARRRGAAQL